MRALCTAGAACVRYLAGKESINISGKCHSVLARQETSKIYACCRGSMRRKTTPLTVLPVHTTKFKWQALKRIKSGKVAGSGITPSALPILFSLLSEIYAKKSNNLEEIKLF